MKQSARNRYRKTAQILGLWLAFSSTTTQASSTNIPLKDVWDRIRETPGLTPNDQCKIEFLKWLGWSGELGKPPNQTVHSRISAEEMAKMECDFESLDELQNRKVHVMDFEPNFLNNLVSTPPTKENLETLKRLIDGTYHSSTNRCAFKLRVKAANQAASQKLGIKKYYQFTSQVRSCHMPDPWANLGPCWFQGREGFPPSRHIEAVYGNALKLECLSAQQLFNYVWLYELLGPEVYDQSLTSAEMLITIQQGSFGVFHPNSPFFSHQEGEQENLDRFFCSTGESSTPARLLGRNGLVGLSGVLYHTDHPFEGNLDSKADRGENFTITDVSADAAQALKKSCQTKDGPPSRLIRNLTDQLFYLTRQISIPKTFECEQKFGGRTPQAIQCENTWFDLIDEIIVHNRKPEPTPRLNDNDEKLFKEILEIKTHPALAGIKMQVHATTTLRNPPAPDTYKQIGAQSLAWHLVRLARLNPRASSYSLSLYQSTVNVGSLHPQGTEKGLFPRARDGFIKACEAKLATASHSR
jgi:hypothetical protein